MTPSVVTPLAPPMSKKVYAPRLAKTVQGGLRPQGGRRDAWWRRRWMEWVEGLRMGARLGRGRSYAQLGQIRSLIVEPGCLTAEVQGAEREPYRASVAMPPLDAEAVEAMLAGNPFLAAQLIAHALPIAFEEALHMMGASLFPQGRKEVTFRCDCKDWARPCKHLAAVLCLFADAIGADPRLLLRFRGLMLPELPPDLTPKVLPEARILDLAPSADVTAIPRRLGALPYWRGTEDFRKTLESAYRRAHDKAVQALNGVADMRLPEDYPPA